jgi:hypothetical protein
MRAFDYGSISDVVLTLRYTSLDGGDKLRDIASGVVGDSMKAVLDAGAPQGAGLFTFLENDVPACYLHIDIRGNVMHPLTDLRGHPLHKTLRSSTARAKGLCIQLLPGCLGIHGQDQLERHRFLGIR